VALCLSGGGYRAMLFHAGALLRLGETGHLSRLDRVSSVSGGSIAAGMLALAWGRGDLVFDAEGRATNVTEAVVTPLRTLASHTIDVRAVLSGLLERGSIEQHAARAYRQYLFQGAQLADLPSRPMFIINATSLQSGALFRFTRQYMADWRVGEVAGTDVLLADAVAASAAFPPYLSPGVIDLKGRTWSAVGELASTEYQKQAVLSDGGVYDNLGLEAAWKRCRTVLVSDAGGHMADDPRPHDDWPLMLLRVLEIVDNQVRDLRKRGCITAYENHERAGGYWGIRSDIANFNTPDVLKCPVAKTTLLAEIPTRLAELDSTTQERLVNWGYAICDASLRAHTHPPPEQPTGFPFPEAAVGG
jgi:NTE family protein